MEHKITMRTYVCEYVLMLIKMHAHIIIMMLETSHAMCSIGLNFLFGSGVVR